MVPDIGPVVDGCRSGIGDVNIFVVVLVYEIHVKSRDQVVWTSINFSINFAGND